MREEVENPMVIDSLWNDWLTGGDSDPWERRMDVDEMIDFLDGHHGDEETQAWIEDRIEDDDLMIALWNRSNYLDGADEMQGLTKDDEVADRVRAFLEANWNSKALWWEMWSAIPDEDARELAKRCIESEDYRDEYNEMMRRREE